MIETRGGPVRLSVEIAETNAQRRFGLMFRDTLSSNAGMIFLFPDTLRDTGRVTEAQFNAIEEGIGEDDVRTRLGPPKRTERAESEGKTMDCWYYGVRGGGGGFWFCFFDGKLELKAPASGGFWMKNTLIPLSIAFFDARGRILRMLDMEPCREEDCPLYDPGVPYHGALEVNRGAFQRWGVRAGDRIRLVP